MDKEEKALFNLFKNFTQDYQKMCNKAYKINNGNVGKFLSTVLSMTQAGLEGFWNNFETPLTLEQKLQQIEAVKHSIIVVHNKETEKKEADNE